MSILLTPMILFAWFIDQKWSAAALIVLAVVAGYFFSLPLLAILTILAVVAAGGSWILFPPNDPKCGNTAMAINTRMGIFIVSMWIVEFIVSFERYREFFESVVDFIVK